jgi:hypothetical protein
MAYRGKGLNMAEIKPEFKEEFKVMARSTNTNSFGLYQMFVISKNGDVYKTHASQYYAKDKGETVIQTMFENIKVFIGHELTEKLPEQAPKTVIEEFYEV